MVSPNHPDQSIRQLESRDLFMEEVNRARGQSPGEKIQASIELFELACELALGHVRSKKPNAADEELIEDLRARLTLARRLEDGR